jgi:hypothetical protein
MLLRYANSSISGIIPRFGGVDVLSVNSTTMSNRVYDAVPCATALLAYIPITETEPIVVSCDNAISTSAAVEYGTVNVIVVVSPLNLSVIGPVIPGGPSSWKRCLSVVPHTDTSKGIGAMHEESSPCGTPPWY